MTTETTTASPYRLQVISQWGDLDHEYRKAQADALGDPMVMAAPLAECLEAAFSLQNGHDPETGAPCPKRYPGLPSLSVGDLVRVCQAGNLSQWYAVAPVGFIRISLQQVVYWRRVRRLNPDRGECYWVVQRWAKASPRAA